jgi:CHAT domain-containing protein
LACLTVGLSVKFGLKRPEAGVGLASQPARGTYDAAHDPEFQAAVKLRQSGHWSKAAAAFDQMADRAQRKGDVSKEARVLLAKAGVQLHQFAYRDANQTYQEILKLTPEVPNDHLTGSVMVNLAEIHTQLGDLTTADREAESAVRLLKRCQRPANLIRAELQLGTIRSALGQEGLANTAYHEAIDQADDMSDAKTEAFVWLILGQADARAGDYAQAKRAYLTAYRISLLSHDPLLDTIRAKLAELELFEGHPAEGLRRLDEVLAHRSPAELGFAEYQVLFRRAQMLAALSRNKEALAMYRKAVDAATHWREEALPGEVADAGSVQAIHEVYAEASDFIASLSLQTHSLYYAREALEILATNRAADLREARTLAWHRDGRLPPRYYQLLSRLRTQEASIILDEARKDEAEGAVRQTRADLAVLETQLAMESEKSVNFGERFGSQKTLEDIQHALSDDDALFSFNLGKRRSWLWAISNRSVNLYQLADATKLERYSSTWASQIRLGKAASDSGLGLAEALFSQVPRPIFDKRNWLVVNDGTLFVNVPLAALPDIYGTRSMNVSEDCSVPPLIANHTVRYLSSELSLSATPAPPKQTLLFAGIGDPVYNVADARYAGPKEAAFSRVSYSSAPTALARLVGSGREVRESAAVFSQSELLTGQSAKTESLQTLLEAKPTVIHLAVHVVSPPGRPEEAALALSLGKDRLPELLTSELIATYRVPGSLVVMSGCDSQQGKAVPGVGVKGLSRAWLLAGASAVIASTWPMPDEDGQFFRSFYRHFNSDSKSATSVPQLAAAALADAQNEMRASSGFRHDPAFWAAYSVISKE